VNPEIDTPIASPSGEPASTPAPVPSPAPSPPRRPWFLVGVIVFFLGIGAYVIQFRLKQFVTPWYAPVLATLGVALMGVSVWQRRGILRSIGLALFVLLCGFEWFLLLVATRTPAYTGPAQPGQKMPAFATTLADGRAFTNHDLENGSGSVLVFFRGRW
jgi:hypothetical protein